MLKRKYSFLISFLLIWFAGCSTDNDLIKQALLGIKFEEPIEVAFMRGMGYWEFHGGTRLQKEEEFLLDMLVNNGYCKYLDAGKERFEPTHKSMALWREEYGWPNYFYYLAIAKRKFVKVTYQKRWKDIGNVEVQSFVFSYYIEPIFHVLENMGKSDVFTGKVQLAFDKSDGKWKILGFNLEKGEVDKFINKSLIKMSQDTIPVKTSSGYFYVVDTPFDVAFSKALETAKEKRMIIQTSDKDGGTFWAINPGTALDAEATLLSLLLTKEYDSKLKCTLSTQSIKNSQSGIDDFKAAYGKKVKVSD